MGNFATEPFNQYENTKMSQFPEKTASPAKCSAVFLVPFFIFQVAF